MDTVPKLLEYKDIGKIPSRKSYLDSSLRKQLNKTLNARKNILFMPNYLYETHLFEHGILKYKIVLIGILPDGRKSTVLIDNIRPYLLVRADEPDDIHAILNGAGIKYNKNFDEDYAKPFKYFSLEPVKWLKVYFDRVFERAKAIRELHKKGYQTANDDLTCYYRVVCRSYKISFTTWIELSQYDLDNNVKGINDIVIRVDIDNYKVYDGPLDMNLKKDKLMTCTWDIETYSPDGSLPMPNSADHCIFMIAMTFQWQYASDSLLKVCLVAADCDPDPAGDFVVVKCANEKELIKAFGKVFAKFMPDIIIGFNDGDYDWPWLVNRARDYKILHKMCSWMSVIDEKFDDMTSVECFNRFYKTVSVKLEAGINADNKFLMLHGYIPIDLRTVYRKLHPTAEKSSLSYFLSISKLGSKEDMPYARLFEIYREITKETTPYWKSQMALVAKYCIVDAYRCHQLFTISPVLFDNRELGNVAYVSLQDAFYRANGMKVRNIAIAYGQNAPFNLRFSNTMNGVVSETDKFPGADVIDPIKGLHTSKLSLLERREHARIIMSRPEPGDELVYGRRYVLAKWIHMSDDIVELLYGVVDKYGIHLDDKKINKLIEKPALAPYAECIREFFSERTGRPITGLDFSSLYPSIIRAYNLSPEYMIVDEQIARQAYALGHKLNRIEFYYQGVLRVGWAVWHDNKLDPEEEGFKFGVFGYVLDNMFQRRKVLKKQMEKYKELREEYESRGDINSPEYDEINFQFNYFNSKQNALKVMMNTFYGDAGGRSSAFRIVELAGGVTMFGRNSLQLAKKKVLELDCCVYYGDTDSIYLSVPERHFDTVDRLFYSGKITKLDYWVKMVEITFKEIEAIKTEVNKVFMELTKTKFLNMAYEEVLFPTAMLAKKNYYGIEHRVAYDYHPKRIFMRGLQVKKRGTSEFLKKIFDKILWTSCSVDNIYSLVELVVDQIDFIYTNNWDFTDFIQSDVLRPAKDNVKIKTFAARMAKEGITIKPNERFRYVIVKKDPFKYDMRGRKSNLSVGDKMELVERAEEMKMQIDIDYYMSGTILGKLATLVAYHPAFGDRAKGLDYLNKCCSRYFTKHESKGRIYQKVYKAVSEKYNRDVTGGVSLGEALSSDQLLKSCCDMVNELMLDFLPERWFGSRVKELGLNAMCRFYFGKKGMDKFMKQKYISREQILLNRLEKTIEKFNSLDKKGKINLQSAIDRVKENLDSSQDLTSLVNSIEFDAIAAKQYNDLYSELTDIYVNIICCKYAYERVQSIVNWLKKKRDISQNIYTVDADHIKSLAQDW